MLALMAAKKKNPETTIRLTIDVAEMVRRICNEDGVSSAELCSPILEAALRERYVKTLNALEKRIAEQRRRFTK